MKLMTSIESAAVVAIDGAGADPHDREKRVREASYDAWRALDNKLLELGLISNTVYCPLDTGVKLLLWLVFKTTGDYNTYFKNRATKAERVLRNLLASDSLSSSQREQVFDVLHGRKKVGRDLKSLSETEKDLIDRYRAMDGDSRQVMRTLARKLSPGQDAHNTKAGRDE
jgi:hypothetical protein